MGKRKYVYVTVRWADGLCTPTTKITLAEWAEILAGDEADTDATYWYEGRIYNASFHFNWNLRGLLRVSYSPADSNEPEDCGTGFEGQITEAEVVGGE